jgi:hypothetical protein
MGPFPDCLRQQLLVSVTKRPSKVYRYSRLHRGQFRHGVFVVNVARENLPVSGAMMRFRIATAALCLIDLVWFMQPLCLLGGSGLFQDSKFIAPTWVPSVGGQPASLFCDFVNGRYWHSGGVQSACPYLIGNETCTDASGNLLKVGNGSACISSAGFGSTFGSFTNSLLQSSTFQASSVWGYKNINDTSFATTTTAPDGTNKAEKLTETSATGAVFGPIQTTTATAAGTYTACGYVKPGEVGGLIIQLQLENDTGNDQYFEGIFGLYTQGSACPPLIQMTATPITTNPDVVTLAAPATTLLQNTNATIQVVTEGANNGVASTVVDTGATMLLGENASSQCATAVGAALASGPSANWVNQTTCSLSWVSGTSGTTNLQGFATSDSGVVRAPSGTMRPGSTGGARAFLDGNVQSIAVRRPNVTFPVYTPVAYYFDSMAGSDSNNCLSTRAPCASTTKMAALRYRGGDTINWKAGSSFTGCLALNAKNVRNTTPANPITIQSYGSGATPIITSNCGAANSGGNGPKTAAITLDSISATVNGIAVRGSGLVSGSATQYGIAAQNSSGVGTPTFVIENVDISGFGAPGATGDAGGEIFVSGFSEAAGFPAACGNINVSILNVTLHGATASSEDDGGFGGAGCYPGSGFVTETAQGVLAYNMGGHPGGLGGCCGSGGTMSSYLAGSYIQFSLAHDWGGNVSTCGGPAGFWAYIGTGGLLQFNEVYNGQNVGGYPGGGACDWAGYDWDSGTTDGVGQYLYSHNNGGPAFLMYNTSGNNVFRYSVSENDAFYVEDGGGAASMGTSSAGSAWAIYNVTIYLSGSFPSNTSPPSCASFGYSGTYSGGLWANNACSNAATDMYGRTFMLNGNNAAGGENTINMVNNDYYNAGGTLSQATGWSPRNQTFATIAAMQSGTGQEANSISTNPSFSSPPSGTCSWTPSTISSWPPSGCPSAYSTIASSLKSAGANLGSTESAYFTAPYPTTAGTRDYYGNTTIPGTGSCFDMGAYGVCP